MAYAGNEFLLKMEDPDNLGTYITIGGAKSCSLSASGSTQSTSEFVGQASELAIPGTKQTTTTISAGGVFVDSDAEQAVFDLKFSGLAWSFKIYMASNKILTGYFYVTAFSRTGDMSAAEGYSISLQGDNISTSSISGEEVDVTWSATRKSALLSLSNSDHTVGTSGGNQGMALATVARSSGKYYFEIEFYRASVGDCLGVVLDSYSGSYSAGKYPGWGVWTDGYGRQHITDEGSGSGPNQGAGRYGFAIDFVAGKLYFRFPDGSWGVNATGNPASGANADFTDAALVGAAVVPAATPYHPGNTDTLYTKLADFEHSLPSGYTAWASPPT